MTSTARGSSVGRCALFRAEGRGASHGRESGRMDKLRGTTRMVAETSLRHSPKMPAEGCDARRVAEHAEVRVVPSLPSVASVPPSSIFRPAVIGLFSPCARLARSHAWSDASAWRTGIPPK